MMCNNHEAKDIISSLDSKRIKDIQCLFVDRTTNRVKINTQKGFYIKNIYSIYCT